MDIEKIVQKQKEVQRSVEALIEEFINETGLDENVIIEVELLNHTMTDGRGAKRVVKRQVIMRIQLA